MISTALAAPWFSSARCLLVVAALLVSAIGCGTGGQKKKQNDFFTSGSRDADQRASQRMAKAEQIAGTGEGTGKKDEKKSEKEQEQKLALYERLGGEAGVGAIVDDFLGRALVDPRVNWERKGVKRGGFWFDRNKSVSWNASQENVATLKKHLAQFIAVAAGGPPQYDGKDMKSAHAGLQIGNAEFDAAVGDLKASLDRLKVGDREQKELLAIIESTRPQVVTQR
jgi:hemoglobin